MQLPVVLIMGPRRDAVSGVSTHLNQLFASQLAHKYRLVHFEVGSEGREESAFGRLVRLVTRPLLMAWRIVMERAVAVHINTSLEPKSYWRDLAFLAVAKLLRRKVVYQVHGGALPEDFVEGSPILRSLLLRVLNWPDVVVLLAGVERVAYARFLPGQRLAVIANAIEAGPYLAHAKPRRVAAGPIRLVYIGRLAYNKGIYEALDAMALLEQRGVACELAIAGSGPAETDLRQRVADRGLDRSVRFLGPVFDERKVRLWLDSDVFVFPTFHHEGLPYALLESMAAGTPAITTRVGAIPDVMHDGVHGLIVAPRSPVAVADAVAALAADRAMLDRMSEAGRSRIAEWYCVERLADEFDRLYAELTNARAIAYSIR